MSIFITQQGKCWPQVVLTVALSAGMAHAAPVSTVQLPAQSLEKSLMQLARQTGVNFGADSQLVAGKQAPALSGSYSVEQALEALLRGTNLYAEPTDDGKGFIIRPLAQVNAAPAQDDAATSAAAEPHRGDVITVQAQVTPGPMDIGSQQLTAEDIAKKPVVNGNITELLRTNPNVQFSESSRNSQTPGELAPDVVSFHGEKFYNNNFMIDGFSNNDRLNPGVNVGKVDATANGNSAADFPSGHPEAFWVDTSLIESLSVYDSNVSAKYGQFTGGVVDAKLKRPSFTEASGSIGYRATRSAWTKYHMSEALQKSFDSPTTLNKQPKFAKNFYNLMVSQPLADNAALMFAYVRKESDIPFYHRYMGKWEDQQRSSENYMLRGAWDVNERNQLTMTVQYSPHSSSFVRSDIKNGNFTNEGGGYTTNLVWDNRNALGKVSTKLAWKQNENTITNKEQNFYYWYKTPSIDWVSGFTGTAAQEGGYGTIKTAQQGLTLKQEWELKAFSTLGIQHRVDVGYGAEIASAKYQRDSASYGYLSSKRTTLVNCAGDTACISGEQYHYKRNVYDVSNVDVSTNTYEAYLQDTLRFQRLTAVPGVRVDYDDYMKNTNISPRLSASYDLWGDRSTELFGGANRYYAGNVLAYKLRSARRLGYTECRAEHVNANGSCSSTGVATAGNVPGEWVYDKALNEVNYNYTSLRTPYSDELTFGIQQRIYDTVWTLKWVGREGKDQFASEKTPGSKTYSLTNNGKMDSDTYSLVVKPIAPFEWNSMLFNWSVGGSIQKTNSSNTAYDDEVDVDKHIIYKGKFMRAIDRPADDFNRPWVTFVELNTEIPAWRLDWTQRLNYVGGYKEVTSDGSLICAGQPACEGYEGPVDIYSEKQAGSNVNLDWRVTYTQPVGKQNVKVGVDVLNVLNRANRTGSNYGLGRQFWVDVTYSW
ncbi:secretin and TonB N-terminal domain-containing protein [Candidatus Symbiopectobacterium sp. NZEC135]|uniref:secretin and TonB N-terminal domain-containing protein n=1 Tax=Candidatus Symbiopectobacterium sp. NZEC135 TaxID=2820471 RepID=UPI0022273E3A|nr:secretin and TonB N-terminal domain-containing protein [Candidatus Symbiopectobacterium sp. NZEC135]MCW2479943.1 secretin and TonB N-terminal domain-containing protein [Candidatus Symbiopectobacterium sp. NZEC135]